MHCAFLILAILTADPTPDQLKLLKTFRDEFVAVTPRDRSLQPYSIAKYELPQNLWQAVMGNNPSRWKGPRNSAEMFSRAEAEEFCQKVTALLQAAALIDRGQSVRLPTEAEWEFAARAGTTTKYSFGEDVRQLSDYGWFTGNAAGNDPAVGAKKPNPWGLYDVHGYLWEWTAADAKSGESAQQAVVRGGSWKDQAEDLASSSRRVVSAALRDDAVGLRCVLTAATTAEAPITSEFRASAQDKIVPPGAKLELVWGEGDFTEGPALASDGSILFSDIGDAIYR